MGDIRLIEGRLPPIADAALAAEAGCAADGAELIFHGCVRGVEGEAPIIALHYECYPGMAEAELRRLADESVRRFSISDLDCIHRVGDVPIGEASLRVTIRSPHRAEALEAMAWFIRQMKRRVPIWKWAVRSDGRREPTASDRSDASPSG